MSEQKRIEKLTPEQEALLPVVRDEWLAHGLSTAPADWDAAKEGVRMAYRQVGLTPPDRFIMLSSPYAGAMAAAMLTDGCSDADIEALIRGDRHPEMTAEFRNKMGQQLYNACYGNHEAGLFAFYDVFGRFGLRACEQMAGLMLIGKSCGWWWPFDTLVILTDRPESLNRDDQNRLHSLDGMALRYRDGWGIYAVHGVRVPEQVIMAPHTLTAKQIKDEPNVELRRVMLDRFGTERYLREIGAKIMHQDDKGTLYRAPLKDDEPLVMVEVVNSTPEPDGSFKKYFIRVPPTVKTATEAVGWTFVDEWKTYAPSIET